MRTQVGLFICTLTLLAKADSAQAQIDQQPRPLNPRFERALNNEPKRVDEIRDGILALQAKLAGPGGQLHRGTHAKGVCASAEFEVGSLIDLDPSIAARLRRGVFSVPGIYPAQIRFANADGKKLPDQEPDVRAASFSVAIPENLAGPQGHLDFAMNDSTTFPINDAEVFANLMTFAKHGKLQGFIEVSKSRFEEEGKLFGGFSALAGISEALKLGAAQKRPLTEGFQKLRYWSTVPFAMGADEAVKYSLKPCAANAAQPLNSDPDTLANELQRHLHEDTPGCFDFQVQLLETKKMRDPQGQPRSAQDWIENATLEWPENQAPFYNVARLTLKKSPEITTEDCEAWKIDVTAHSNPTHRGLGSINRARASAERASAEARQR